MIPSPPPPPEQEPVFRRQDRSVISGPLPNLLRLEQASQYTRSLEIHLGRGNHEAARQVLEYAIEAMKTEPDSRQLWDVPLVDTAVPLRVINALENAAGCITIGDFRELTLQQMLSIPNMNDRSIDNLYAAVLDYCAARLAQAALLGQGEGK